MSATASRIAPGVPEPVLTPEQHKELKRWMTPAIEGEVVGPRPTSAPAPPQIAPPALGDRPTPASPVQGDSAATEGTRLLPRRDHGGRFVPRTTFPCCEGCGRTLAESLTGATYCPWTECRRYRKTAGVVAGVDAGTVTAEVLA